MPYKKFLPSMCLPSKVQDSDDRDAFIAHIHMPKTAGTTFNSILESNLKKAFERYEGRMIHLFPRISAEQMLEYITVQESMKALTSHQLTAILPYSGAPRNVFAVVFLRDPVEQFFSGYFHLRRFGMKCPQREMNLEDFVKFCVKTNRFTDWTQFIAPMPGNASYLYILQLIQSQRLLVLPTERFDASLKLLQKKFPSHFTDISYQRKNISPRDQEVTAEMKERIRERIPAVNFRLHELSLRLVAAEPSAERTDMGRAIEAA